MITSRNLNSFLLNFLYCETSCKIDESIESVYQARIPGLVEASSQVTHGTFYEEIKGLKVEVICFSMDSDTACAVLLYGTVTFY